MNSWRLRGVPIVTTSHSDDRLAEDDAPTPDEPMEWMKILGQLESNPNLGGSIRELRELLMQAINAAKEDERACTMQVLFNA